MHARFDPHALSYSAERTSYSRQRFHSAKARLGATVFAWIPLLSPLPNVLKLQFGSVLFKVRFYFGYKHGPSYSSQK